MAASTKGKMHQRAQLAAVALICAGALTPAVAASATVVNADGNRLSSTIAAPSARAVIATWLHVGKVPAGFSCSTRGAVLTLVRHNQEVLSAKITAETAAINHGGRSNVAVSHLIDAIASQTATFGALGSLSTHLLQTCGAPIRGGH